MHHRILKTAAVVAFTLWSAAAQAASPQPLPLRAVKINDPFWTPRYHTWTTVTVYDVLDKFEGGYQPDREDLQKEKASTGHTRNAFENFDLVAKGEHDTNHGDGPPWYDGLVYETITGAADLLQQHPDARLEQRLDGYIRRIAAAQAVDKDGYLNTYTTLHEAGHRWGLNGGNDRWQHDVYNAGMLVEAGVHYYNATGKTSLLQVAVKMANYMCSTMGKAPLLNVIPAHAGPEGAFLELAALIKSHPNLHTQLHADDAAYFAMADYWISHRGVYTDADGGRPRHSDGSYNQDQAPVFEQTSMEGHAVRATLLANAVAGMAAQTRDPRYVITAERYWSSMAGKRMFITGGQGAIAEDEKFGPDYFLPENAYLETCAAVGAGFFSAGMNALLGDGKYMDEVERVLYNNILSGVGEDGMHYYYENPLQAQDHPRWSWHSCPCCPPMFLKMIGALPGYIYGQDSSGLYVNLFIGSEAKVKWGKQEIGLEQSTQYPWKGVSSITMSTTKPATFPLRVRIPGWALGKENPYDLYTSTMSGQVTLKVNGQVVPLQLDHGYAVLQRTWMQGDVVELSLPVQPRLVSSAPQVQALQAKLAIAAGPLVYALENKDNTDISSLRLAANILLQATYRDTMGGMNIITGEDVRHENFTAIPFYAIGNRGPAAHEVWLPARQQAHITVYADSVMNPISPLIYGTNVEDVNHEIYGGLYDQRIFGESFEEPATGVNLRDWKRYTGYWLAAADTAQGVSIYPGRNTTREMGEQNIRIGVEPDESAKLVYDPLVVKEGSVSVAVNFHEHSEGNAGLLIGVNHAGVGADNFNGYEISLAADGKKVVLGRHRFNFEPLAEAAVVADPAAWNALRVQWDTRQLEVWLNDKSVLTWAVKDATSLQGKIAVRTWRSAVSFRDVVISQFGKTINAPLFLPPSQQVSYNWDAVQTPGVQGIFNVDTISTFNGRQSQSMTFNSGKGRLGLANRGLNRWGIATKAGVSFTGSISLKQQSITGSVTVALESEDGTHTYASQRIAHITSGWKRYSFSLAPNTTDPHARFVVYIANKGELWVDQVMLQTAGQTLPVRQDIGAAIQAEGITFMRYCGTMVNAKEYRFWPMTGPREQRPPYHGHWNKYSTNGFGIEDFLQYSASIHITPLFSINIEESESDMRNMVEYLNGDSTTQWGRQRAANGHSAPYGVHYIEIGNEEVIFEGDDAIAYQHYIDRFTTLARAMHEKDTSLQLVCSAWWRPGSPNMEKVFRAIEPQAAFWDLHVDADQANSGSKNQDILTDMLQRFHAWNPATNVRVAILEENGGLHNMQRALGHATNLNAIRRAGPFVLTSTPANGLQPAGQNDNGWDQGQIFFSSDTVWMQPPFYVQQMAASHHLPLRIQAHATTALDLTATRSENGDTLDIHVVNIADDVNAATIMLPGFQHSGSVECTTLQGALYAENNIGDMRVLPQTKMVTAPVDTIPYNFPPHSYTILQFCKEGK